MAQISRKILFVDDEPNLLAGVQRQLRRHFKVLTAESGREGLELLEQQGPVAVVVADFNMPEMNGVAFLHAVHERSPDTVAVMLTGWTDLSVAVAALHEGHVFRFLNKPCPTELLHQTLEDCLEQYRLTVSERMLTAELNHANIELNRANEELRLLNQELEHRVAARTATIRRLHQFVSSLNALDSLDEIGELVVSTTVEMLQSRRVSLMLPDASGEYLRIAAARGMDPEIIRRARIPIGSSIAGRVFASSTSIVVNDASELAQHPDRYDSAQFASVPLALVSVAAPGGPVGVLNVCEPLERAVYDPERLASLRAIAEAAAIAISNQLHRQERDHARDTIILTLARLTEHRDFETGAHLERVQVYCRLLAEALAETPKHAPVVTKTFIDSLVRSAPLHDIGKVGVPDRILLKPGKLSPEEFAEMTQHSEIGCATLREAGLQGRRHPFLQMAVEVARHHHEKFDGTGYPDGLAGEAIPLSARIVALADVYDALTSKRIYKPAIPHEQAATIIRQESGTHFDPDVVEAFVRRSEEFGRIAAEHQTMAQAHPGEPEAALTCAD